MIQVSSETKKNLKAVAEWLDKMPRRSIRHMIRWLTDIYEGTKDPHVFYDCERRIRMLNELLDVEVGNQPPPPNLKVKRGGKNQ